MSFTYDTTTDLGRVRLLITDRDAARPIFDDAEITAFLDLNDGSVAFAAGQALRTIAASEVLILKRITTLDLTTDGPAVAKSLNELADKIEAREAEGGYFDWAEAVETPWQSDERVLKQWERGAL